MNYRKSHCVGIDQLAETLGSTSLNVGVEYNVHDSRGYLQDRLSGHPWIHACLLLCLLTEPPATLGFYQADKLFAAFPSIFSRLLLLRFL